MTLNTVHRARNGNANCVSDRDAPGRAATKRKCPPKCGHIMVSLPRFAPLYRHNNNNPATPITMPSIVSAVRGKLAARARATSGTSVEAITVRLVMKLFVGLSIAYAPTQAIAEPYDPFLSNLVGCWRLSGHMVDTPLNQALQARWVLGGTFLEVASVQTDRPAPGKPPYQAIYLIGRDSGGEFVFNLFDTFGVTKHPIAGIGTLRGHSITFVFDYPEGEFQNTLSWDPKQETWDMHLQQVDASGNTASFAEKHLTRCSAPD